MDSGPFGALVTESVLFGSKSVCLGDKSVCFGNSQIRLLTWCALLTNGVYFSVKKH